MDIKPALNLPPQPEEPLESECCGSGCSPCVFDIYQKQLVEWKKKCELIINGKDINIKSDEFNKTPLSQLKFSAFQLISIQQHTHNTYFYIFQAVKSASSSNLTLSDDKEFSADKRSLNIKIGQHLIMNGRNGESDNSVISRAYTPLFDADLDSMGCFKIVVKLYQNGKMSKIFKSLKENNITEWRGPYGDYDYVRNSNKVLLMLGAGTGIAPMYSIAKSIVEDDFDETSVHLLFACRKFEDILLRNEIQALTLYWNFSAEIYLSQTTSEELKTQSRYGETIHNGRIDKDVVKKELETKLDQVFVLICGTNPFNKDMMNFLKQSGLTENKIHLF